MKEDVLEQLVDEYLMHQGYFTIHNVKFKPRRDHPDFNAKLDSVPSDIDVIGYNPTLVGPARVVAVSCKSWQGGFDPQVKLTEFSEGKITSGREAWKQFRELLSPKWTDAFVAAVERWTGTRCFEYWTAVTHVRNPDNRAAWEENPAFRTAMGGNPIRIVSFRDLIDGVWRQLDRSPAASELGRMVQLMKASGWQTP